MFIFKVLKKIFYKIFYFIMNRIYGNFGKGSKVIKPLYIAQKKHIFIGNCTTIYKNALIEPIVRWDDGNCEKEFDPHITIEDNVWIGEGVHITCADKIVIGKGTSITAYCVITDISHSYEDIRQSPGTQQIIVNSTFIGEDCFIGSGTKIMPGVTIGKHCIVGANAVVSKSIPDYCVAAGIPAKIIKRYNFGTNKWEKVK